MIELTAGWEMSWHTEQSSSFQILIRRFSLNAVKCIASTMNTRTTGLQMSLLTRSNNKSVSLVPAHFKYLRQIRLTGHKLLSSSKKVFPCHSIFNCNAAIHIPQSVAQRCRSSLSSLEFLALKCTANCCMVQFVKCLLIQGAFLCTLFSKSKC